MKHDLNYVLSRLLFQQATLVIIPVRSELFSLICRRGHSINKLNKNFIEEEEMTSDQKVFKRRGIFL